MPPSSRLEPTRESDSDYLSSQSSAALLLLPFEFVRLRESIFVTFARIPHKVTRRGRLVTGQMTYRQCVFLLKTETNEMGHKSDGREKQNLFRWNSFSAFSWKKPKMFVWLPGRGRVCVCTLQGYSSVWLLPNLGGSRITQEKKPSKRSAYISINSPPNYQLDLLLIAGLRYPFGAVVGL